MVGEPATYSKHQLHVGVVKLQLGEITKQLKFHPAAVRAIMIDSVAIMISFSFHSTQLCSYLDSIPNSSKQWAVGCRVSCVTMVTSSFSTKVFQYPDYVIDPNKSA